MKTMSTFFERNKVGVEGLTDEPQPEPAEGVVTPDEIVQEPEAEPAEGAEANPAAEDAPEEPADEPADDPDAPERENPETEGEDGAAEEE
jgi:hypothetical protein